MNREFARGWVDDARTFYLTSGKSIALAEFTNPRGMFAEGELYIFVLNFQGIMLAHGVNEKFVGEDFLDVKDFEGKYFIKEIVDTATKKGSGWVEYRWFHPKTKKVLPKVVYFEKVDNLIICCGTYSLATSVLREIDLNAYRKETQLRDGTKILVRPMVAEDKNALYEFFKAVPREETRLLRDDVSSVLLIEQWANNLNYTKTLPILALKEGKIICDATINRRRSGWKWHLGTVRIFVHEDYRKIGLGHLMIEELSDIAYKVGIEKLLAEVPDTSTSAINAFTGAGFYRAAVIPNLAKDKENMPLNIVVMIKDINPALDDTHGYAF